VACLLRTNAVTNADRGIAGSCLKCARAATTTKLGIMYEAATPKRAPRIGCIKETERKTDAKNKVIEKMMHGLPTELTKEQRRKVKGLLSRYHGILSMEDHDIG